MRAAAAVAALRAAAGVSALRRHWFLCGIVAVILLAHTWPALGRNGGALAGGPRVGDNWLWTWRRCRRCYCAVKHQPVLVQVAVVALPTIAGSAVIGVADVTAATASFSSSVPVVCRYSSAAGSVVIDAWLLAVLHCCSLGHLSLVFSIRPSEVTAALIFGVCCCRC